MKARDWLTARIKAAKAVSDDSWETVAGFALLWSLFEARLCGEDACQGDFEQLAQNYPQPLTPEMEAAYAYWVNRYLTGAGAATRFDELFERPSGQADVHAVLSTPNPTLDRKVFALLMIVYRLRNNLFHGVKKIETFNEQRENLQFASDTLEAVMEHFGVT